MIDNPHIIFTQILEIIDFKNNKKEFIDSFFNICRQQTILNLINTLPESKREFFKEAIEKQASEADLEKLFREHFTDEEYKIALGEVVKTNFSEFIKQLLPTLSSSKQTQLKEFLESIN